MNPFFIVGCGRSGTTLLQQALNRHSQIAIPPETAYFTFLGLSRRAQQDHLQRINADLQIALPVPFRRVHHPSDARMLFERMAGLYLERLGKPGVTHFGEKSPEHQRRLKRLRQVFPEAKIILLYRDGRDVACLLRKLPWMSPDLYVNFALWLHYYRLQRQALRARDLDLLCVKYEDLVTAPESECRRVLEFLGLLYEPQVVAGEGNVEGVAAWELPWKARALERINTSRIGLWRQELTPEQVGLLERWGGWALRDLGYDLATDGRRRLSWTFLPKVYWRGLVWLACRARYGKASNLYGSQPVLATSGSGRR